MNEYMRQQTGHQCPPDVTPADQPHLPKDGEPCSKLPETTPPPLEKPKPCPDPDPCCKCPDKPTSPPTCLEEMIEEQDAVIRAAEPANKFRADLVKLLENARKASQAFTRDKYQELLTEWLKQDLAIAELVRKLECAVWCWPCILDCHVCPLLNELHYAEIWLYGDGKLPTEVHNLYDLQYWHQQDLAMKKRRFERIDSVMKAWGNPMETIGKALAANRAVIEAAGKSIGPDPGKAIYDVFLRLLPTHLAIAPPADAEAEPNTTTKIDKKYTQLCKCDQGTPNICCGVDLGEWSLRQRLIGPQPFLIDPTLYFEFICCLVKDRYRPAKQALDLAEANLASVASRIARYEAQLKDGWAKNFETAAKGAIPSVINCCDYKKDETKEKSLQAR